MSWYCGYSLNQLLAEINDSAPRRSKKSDGSIGDQAHQSRTSDHNPCKCHTAVCARDFTNDPAGGFDAHSFADWLRKRCASNVETRVKYIISNRRIASPTKDWVWRAYTGSNPHAAHIHISVLHGPEKFNDKKSWGWKGVVTPPKPPVQEDEDMLFDGFWKRPQNDAVYAIFKDGTKQWMIDPPHFDGMVGLQKLHGANDEQLSVRTCEDPGMFAAMGIVIGPVPAGCDNWGNPV